MKLENLWSELYQIYEGRRFFLNGNDLVLKDYLKGYFIFLAKQKGIKITRKDSGLIEPKDNLIIGNTQRKGWSLVLSDFNLDDSIILPCWKKFSSSNLKRILTYISLPIDFKYPCKKNLQEQILSKIYPKNSKIFGNEGILAKSDEIMKKKFIYGGNVISEEMWVLNQKINLILIDRGILS